MDRFEGKQIGGYEIQDLLGEGGMARVYRARQLSLEREVALKIVPFSSESERGVVERFEREKSILKSLEHPHILPIFDWGREPGLLWIAMQIVRGGTLQEMVGRPLDLPLVARLLSQIGPALTHAHRKGVIHRDLKPGNVLVSEGPHCYLSDFGIAKLLEGSHLTTTGSFLGTPAYMAPEQIVNKSVDCRVDIYALGVLTYQLVTGLLPFEGPVHSVIHQHLNTLPASPRELLFGLPQQIDRIIMKALAKDPDERFESAQEMAEAFLAAVEGRKGEVAHLLRQGQWDEEPPQDPPAAPPTNLLPGPRRGRLLFPLGGVALCALVATAAVKPAYKLLTGHRELVQTHALAYTWRTSNIARSIYVKAPGELPTPLVTEGATPRFSADGKWLTYDHKGAIYTMPRLGGQSQPLVRFGPLNYWGTRLSGDNEMLFHSNRQGQFHIYSQPLVAGKPSGPPRQVTVEAGSQQWASPSPDGRQIAYASTQSGSQAIWVRGYPQGQPRQLSRPNGAADTCPNWSPDGTQIVFERNRGGFISLVVCQVADGVENELKLPQEHPHHPCWEPSPYIAFVSKNTIYIMDPRTRQTLQALPDSGGGAEYAYPRFVPGTEVTSNGPQTK